MAPKSKPESDNDGTKEVQAVQAQLPVENDLKDVQRPPSEQSKDDIQATARENLWIKFMDAVDMAIYSGRPGVSVTIEPLGLPNESIKAAADELFAKVSAWAKKKGLEVGRNSRNLRQQNRGELELNETIYVTWE